MVIGGQSRILYNVNELVGMFVRGGTFQGSGSCFSRYVLSQLHNLVTGVVAPSGFFDSCLTCKRVEEGGFENVFKIKAFLQVLCYSHAADDAGILYFAQRQNP